MKVYIVMEGSQYDSTTIVATYATKEKAEERIVREDEKNTIPMVEYWIEEQDVIEDEDDVDLTQYAGR